MPLVCVPEFSPHVIFLLAKPALLSLTATPVPGHRGIQLRPPPASLSPATPNTSSPAPKGASTKPLSKPISKSGTTLAPTFVTPPQKRYFCLYSKIRSSIINHSLQTSQTKPVNTSSSAQSSVKNLKPSAPLTEKPRLVLKKSGSETSPKPLSKGPSTPPPSLSKKRKRAAEEKEEVESEDSGEVSLFCFFHDSCLVSKGSSIYNLYYLYRIEKFSQ